MRIVGVHRVPWHEEAFRQNVEFSGPEFEDQVRENWENAWLFVAESDDQIEFGELGMQSRPGQDPDSIQAAWLESRMTDGRWGFFLHYWTPACTLFDRGQHLPVPSPSEAPASIWEQIKYEAPD
jgi:hypothetical protein